MGAHGYGAGGYVVWGALCRVVEREINWETVVFWGPAIFDTLECFGTSRRRHLMTTGGIPITLVSSMDLGTSFFFFVCGGWGGGGALSVPANPR